jgi:hypothetical protein
LSLALVIDLALNHIFVLGVSENYSGAAAEHEVVERGFALQDTPVLGNKAFEKREGIWCILLGWAGLIHLAKNRSATMCGCNEN